MSATSVTSDAPRLIPHDAAVPPPASPTAPPREPSRATPRALALAAVAPIAIGATLAARTGDLAALAATPAIVFGVVAATCPALYIAIAATGDAPPLLAVARALGVALAAFGIALAGLVLPTAFLSLSSVAPGTTIAACTCALGGAAVLALRRLERELAPRTVGGLLVYCGWSIAVLGIAGRLWWDLATEVFA